MTTLNNSIAESAWQACMGKIVGNLGAATSHVLVLIGRRLGLDKALAEHGPLLPEARFNWMVEARR